MKITTDPPPPPHEEKVIALVRWEGGLFHYYIGQGADAQRFALGPEEHERLKRQQQLADEAHESDPSFEAIIIIVRYDGVLFHYFIGQGAVVHRFAFDPDCHEALKRQQQIADEACAKQKQSLSDDPKN